MIFATVGTQLPFPRLIGALNALAPGLGEPVVAQTGPKPEDWAALECHETLTPQRFEENFTAARVVVAHAGIGTILSAQRHGKPLILLPRKASFGEHRNDHQMATARQVAQLPGIHVAWEVDDLGPLLDLPDLEPASAGLSPSRQALIARLRAFIETA